MAGSRILFTTQPASGHLRPLVPLAQAALRRGHRVAVCSAPRLAAEVASYGLEFVAAGYDWAAHVPALLPGDYSHLSFADAADALAVAEAGVVDLFTGVAARRTCAQLLEVATRWRPDLVVRELDEFGGYLAAEVLDIPHVSVASFGGPQAVRGPRVAAALDRNRRELGLPPDPEGERPYAHLHASLLPPLFGAAELALPRTRCYQHADSYRLRERLPDWVADLPSERPLVFVGLGTVVYDLPGARAVLATVIEALAGLDCTAVVAVGTGRDPARLPAAANVRLTSFVPQPHLLASCDLFVSHGGLNSIKEATRAGVPLVGLPVLGDHRHNLRRCVDLGTALTVDLRALTVKALRAACRQVLADPSYRRSTLVLQRHMLALPGVDDLLDDLETLVSEPLPGTPPPAPPLFAHT